MSASSPISERDFLNDLAKELGTRSATPPPAPWAGEAPRQLGEYRVLREVGRGGMGVVYEAVQESLGRHVALKVLAARLACQGDVLERFRREARVTAQLNDSNIVPVFGVGEDQGAHYYAMQLIQGQGLDAVLQDVKRLRDDRTEAGDDATVPADVPAASVARGLLNGHFSQVRGQGPKASKRDSEGPEVEARRASEETRTPTAPPRAELAGQPDAPYFRAVARLGLQAAEALAHAHGHGVLHRDVKPSNLLLDTQGILWITDFGLAKIDYGDDLTHTGDIVGTLRYMAPERFGGRANARSDVYGLGLTLYELLTLRPAFGDSDRLRLMERVAHESPPPPRRIDARIPRDLETIVLKAMACDPSDRYATAAALSEDLRRFLAVRTILARRSSAAERFRRWCQRNPVVAALSGAVAALLLLVAGSFQAAWRLSEEAEDLRDQLARSRRTERESNAKLVQVRLPQARAARHGQGGREPAAARPARREYPVIGHRLSTHRKEHVMRVVLQGDRVRVHYVKRFQGGCVVSSRGKTPTEVTIGVDHRRLPGLGLALVGLAVGESRTLFVPVQQAYGLYDARRVYRLDRTRFVGQPDLSVGKWLRVWDRRHRRRLVRVVELREHVVVVDTNHRWAGQSLELEVEVMSIYVPNTTSAAANGAEGNTLDAEGDLREGLWLEDGSQN
jgi:serine/threonine protein kinase/FKBP-type peptidyl-prolyl cis-trans isomerase 2